MLRSLLTRLGTVGETSLAQRAARQAGVAYAGLPDASTMVPNVSAKQSIQLRMAAQRQDNAALGRLAEQIHARGLISMGDLRYKRGVQRAGVIGGGVGVAAGVQGLRGRSSGGTGALQSQNKPIY